MGAEHSQQRAEADGREIFDSSLGPQGNHINSASSSHRSAATATGAIKKRTMLRQSTAPNSSTNTTTNKLKHSNDPMPSPTTSEMSRPSSPPLSVCSDLPYVSYTTDRPIGDSPKIRGKSANSLTGSSTQRNSLVLRRPQTAAKPKRPQSTVGSHSIVIVKPGIKDANEEIESELQQLQSIPQFLPVLRDSVYSATFTKDAECLERLQIQPHLLNICNRMQTHLNMCATQVAQEQSHLVERTKVVSNSITTLFASFVDMQKSYAAYAEQFNKVRLISQQLSRCNSLLNDNLASLEAINNFLDVEDRLEPFVWRTDDNKLRGEAEGAAAAAAGSMRLRRL
ncbi:BLOC-1-related complex subunit 5 [Lucilia sericata]|uniref:BLOC-1-related complex subunit 5 n=1 Tax=Lucilia sericata TaxID=13632 RepID=UPI0018A848B4|nr:BLOC-1-related complex subunit 5 [Lucilia sericata]